MESADSSEATSNGDSEILGRLAGSLNTILEYAGPDLDTVSSFRQHVHAYKQLSDRSSQDQEVTLLRRQLTEEFYLLYSLLFTQTLERPDIPMPVRMFLYFGYVDEELAGLKNAGVKIFSGGSMEMDLTQTSYSTVPSIDIELGDGGSDHSAATLDKLGTGLADGVDAYFGK